MSNQEVQDLKFPLTYLYERCNESHIPYKIRSSVKVEDDA